MRMPPTCTWPVHFLRGPTSIAVDGSGNAYVTGHTDSTDFPTANPLQADNHGFSNAFVTKINAAGSALVYSTYLGGYGGFIIGGSDSGSAIAVDALSLGRVFKQPARWELAIETGKNGARKGRTGKGEASSVRLSRRRRGCRRF